MILSDLSLVFLISAAVTFTIAFLSRKYPASNSRGLFPYKTPESTRSVESWDYAQRMQPFFQFLAGLFQLFAAGVFFFLPRPELLISCLLIAIVIMVSFLFVVIGIETKLKMARKRQSATS